MDPEFFDYPVYSTPFGGLVRSDENNLNHVFVSKPNCHGFEIGDVMPSAWWPLTPANELAEYETRANEDRMWQETCDDDINNMNIWGR